MTRFGVGTLTLAMLLAGATGAMADCAPQRTALATALKAGNIDQADKLVAAIGVARECGPDDNRAARRAYAEGLLGAARALQSRPDQAAAAEALIDRAVYQNVYWRASFIKGEAAFARKDFRTAFKAYENAVQLLEQEEDDKTVAEIKKSQDFATLKAKIYEAWQISTAGSNGRVLKMPPSRDGGIGGVYSPLLTHSDDAGVRGAEAERLPVPIQFVYNSDEFTPVGQQAADQLIEVLKERGPKAITVVGHTDAIGSQQFNQILSEKRAKKLAEYLRSKQILCPIQVMGRGKLEPRKLADPSVYTQDEINELNRRVEFSWQQ